MTAQQGWLQIMVQITATPPRLPPQVVRWIARTIDWIRSAFVQVVQAGQAGRSSQAAGAIDPLSILLSASRSLPSEPDFAGNLPADPEQWRYQAILEDQTELICRYLPDTTILYVNDAYCRYFGLTKPDLIGKSYAPVVYEDDRPLVSQLIDSLNSRNPQVTIENRVIVNGEVRWTQWNNRCFYDDQGQIVECQSVGRDITQLKAVETALRESEQRYRTLIEAIPQLVWVAAVDGVTRIDYNQRWFDYTGQSPTAVMGDQWLSVMHPDDVETALQQWQTALAEGTSYEAEYRLRRADGVYVWHLSKGEPVRNEQGQIIRWYGTCTDISERKRHEAERQRTQQALQQLNETLELRVVDRTAELVTVNADLRREIQDRQQAEQSLQQLNLTLEQRVRDRTQAVEAANQELEAFAYSVAHDLRAPLRAIQGFAQVLLEDYGPLLDELGQEYVQRMATSAEHLDVLIEDLLTYSRLGRAEIHLQQVNLAALLDSILSELESVLRAKQATIAIESELPIVYAQRSVLKQILINLIDNGLKFVAAEVSPQLRIWVEPQALQPDSSNIPPDQPQTQRPIEPPPIQPSQTQPSQIQPSQTQPPQWIRLWIADNGIGINPNHQARIFRAFERLHGVEVYPGTGIGLAIVKRGIERLGGRVGVESAVHQGSRFWIELPIYPKQDSL